MALIKSTLKHCHRKDDGRIDFSAVFGSSRVCVEFNRFLTIFGYGKTPSSHLQFRWEKGSCYYFVVDHKSKHMCLILFIPILMNDSKRFTNIIKTAFSVIRSKDFVTSFAHLNWMPSSYCTLNFDVYFSSLFLCAKECKTLFQLLNKYFSKLFECYRSQFIQLGILSPNDDGFFLAKCNDFASYQQ